MGLGVSLKSGAWWFGLLCGMLLAGLIFLTLGLLGIVGFSDPIEQLEHVIRHGGSENFEPHITHIRWQGRTDEAYQVVKTLAANPNCSFNALEALVMLDIDRGQLRANLLEFGQSDKPALKGAAIFALKVAGIKSKDVLDFLISTLDHPDAQMRNTALQALWGFDEAAAPALPRVLELLDDPECAGDAAYCLGSMGNVAEDAGPRLLAMGRETAGFERLRAVTGLLKTQQSPTAAVEVLLLSLEEDSTLIQIYAVRELRDIGPPARAALPALRSILEKELPPPPPPAPPPKPSWPPSVAPIDERQKVIELQELVRSAIAAITIE